MHWSQGSKTVQTPRRRSDRIKVIREHAEAGTKEWEATRVLGHNREGSVLSLSVIYKVEGRIAWIMAKYLRAAINYRNM